LSGVAKKFGKPEFLLTADCAANKDRQGLTAGRGHTAGIFSTDENKDNEGCGCLSCRHTRSSRLSFPSVKKSIRDIRVIGG
jgi:hypothetical protein